MNEDIIHRHYTLLDMIQMSGSQGLVACVVALALWSVGIAFVVTGPGLRWRRAYLMACLIPAISGVAGFLISFMSAFATLGVSGVGDGFKFFSALGEIVLPMMFGFIGSGIALMIGALVWMRREKHPPSTQAI